MAAGSDSKGDLGNLLVRSVVDPQRFEELVAAWNVQFDPERGPPGPTSLIAAAHDALDAMAGESERGVRPEIKRMINDLAYSVVVTSRGGLVRGMNTQAMARLHLEIGGEIDTLDYQLEGGELISDAVARLLDPRGRKDELVLEREVHDPSCRIAKLAMVPRKDRPQREASVLLFVIDPEQREKAKALMARAYDLTPSKRDVLSAFLDGASLADIASGRGRSLATVRTQFQRVLAKSGASSQAELMRNALVLSQFVTEVSEIAEVARHPHRRKAQILRPGGRRVAVVLAGDFSGAPLLFLSTLTHHALPAEIEARLKSAGLLAIHLWRPGFGGTDPPARGETYARRLAGRRGRCPGSSGCRRGRSSP